MFRIRRIMMCSLMALALVLTAACVPAAAESGSGIPAPYVEVLRHYRDRIMAYEDFQTRNDEQEASWGYPPDHTPLYAALVDLTGDGQEELLFIASNGECRGTEWYGSMADLYVFTRIGDRAEQILFFPYVYAYGGNYPMYEIYHSVNTSDLYVHTSNNGPGTTVCFAPDAEGRYVEKTRLACILPDPEGDEDENTYMLNGEPVSEEAYFAAAEEFDADETEMIASTEQPTYCPMLSVRDIPEVWQGPTNDELYAWVLDMYFAGMSGDESVTDSEEFNFSAWMCGVYSETDPLYAVGYAYMDLDGDGNDELIIADASPDGSADGTIFDVWGVRDGIPATLIQGWERNRLYLTGRDEDGACGYYQEGSDSAFESMYAIGRFTPGGTAVESTLEYNAENPDPWMLGGLPVDEATADAVIGEWRGGMIPLTLAPIASWGN